MFSYRNENTTINKSPNYSVNDLIKEYYKKNNFNEENKKIFSYEGKNLASEENTKKKIKDLLSKDSKTDCIDIIVQDYIKINFKEKDENSVKESEIFLDPEETVAILINKYYEKNPLNKDNQKLFIFNGNNLTSEENKKTKIKDHINGDLDDNCLTIKVIEIKDTIKVVCRDIDPKDTEIFLEPEETVNNLIKIYYKMKGLNKENKKIFLCSGKNLSSEDKKNAKVKDEIRSDDIIAVIEDMSEDKEDKEDKENREEKKDKEDKKIKIVFSENQNRREFFINSKETVRSLIRKYNENQEKEKMFLFGGDNLATEENIEKTISDIIPKDEESNVSHTILVNEIESIK
jgi:hypothetical protein